jgi:head-tail adaptor
MKIRKLNERITLFKRTIIEQIDGDFKEEWIPLTMVWASLTPFNKPNDNAFQNEGWNQKEAISMKKRYTLIIRDGNPNFLRVKWKNNWYQIISPIYNDHGYQSTVIQEVIFK